MANESLLNTNWNSGDTITATELNTHGQEHLDLDGHGDSFHSVQYLKSLTGGNGIDPSSIGDGDTLSVAWTDANDLSTDGSLTNDSVTVAGNSVALGGSTGVAHGDLSDAPLNAHHQDPSAGTGITDEGTNQFGISSGGVTDTELGVHPFSYDPGMNPWKTGTKTEINRIALAPAEKLVVERVEFRQDGGGSNSSADIAVSDVSQGAIIGSANLGATTKNPGSSSEGATLIVRVSNSTGGTITAAPRVQGYITGV